MHADITPDLIDALCEIPAILSIAPLAMATVENVDEDALDLDEFGMDDSIDIGTLKPVVLLDTGVDLPDALMPVQACCP